MDNLARGATSTTPASTARSICGTFTLDWWPIEDLLPEHLGEWPRIVEYGNQYANRAINTDGSGWAGVVFGPPAQVGEYGKYIDLLKNTTAADEVTPDKKPSNYVLGLFNLSAQARLDQANPPPVAVVVQENSTLLPSSPWNINTLTPGTMFDVIVEHSCRTVVDLHKLKQVAVLDDEEGENVTITSQQAPKGIVIGSSPWP